MTLALNGLPPFTRLVGWWEGANNNQRHLGMYIPKMGIASPRRKNAKYYYVQVFGKSREGYELPLGKARFHIDQVSKGDNVTVPVLSPYHGKEGTITLRDYAPPQVSSENISGVAFFSWGVQYSYTDTAPSLCTVMESAFMDYHGKYNQGDFLERVMMPAFRTAFTSVPVAVFANLEPYNGTYEDDKTLNNFLIIAVQRAGFGDNRFSNLKDDNEKASVLALFCATPANTMPYTMDSRRGEMSEWFGSPRNRKTGDCEDVSQDALMVFRALRRCKVNSSYPELSALQAFSQKYTCYMVLGTATSASADGLYKNNSLMAHMWNILMNNDNGDVYLIESTGFVNPTPHRMGDTQGISEKGKDYMSKLNKSPADGGLQNGPYLGYLKRFLTDWPQKDNNNKFVVSEFYCHLCYGVPHDGTEMIAFKDKNNKVGPYFSEVLMSKNNYKTEKIENTAYKSLEKDEESKTFVERVKNQIEPIPLYRFHSFDNLKDDSPIKYYEKKIKDVLKNKLEGRTGDTKFDGRILVLSEVLQKKGDGETKIMTWLKNDFVPFVTSVRLDTQVVCMVGDNPSNVLAAFQVNFKLNNNYSTSIALNAPSGITLQSLIF